MSKQIRVPQEIINVLEEAGDYSFEQGSRHIRILVDGQQVGILPNGKNKDGQSRGRRHKNTVAALKRKVRAARQQACDLAEI